MPSNFSQQDNSNVKTILYLILGSIIQIHYAMKESGLYTKFSGQGKEEEFFFKSIM